MSGAGRVDFAGERAFSFFFSFDPNVFFKGRCLGFHPGRRSSARTAPGFSARRKGCTLGSQLRYVSGSKSARLPERLCVRSQWCFATCCGSLLQSCPPGSTEIPHPVFRHFLPSSLSVFLSPAFLFPFITLTLFSVPFFPGF